MDLQLTGTIKQILKEQSGQGKNGTWRKRDFILETPGKYPQLVCITQWGDQIDKTGLQEGETITASIDIQSREYKGNWYTDVKAWKIEKGDAKAGSGREVPPEANVIDFGPGDDDDAPF